MRFDNSSLAYRRRGVSLLGLYMKIKKFDKNNQELKNEAAALFFESFPESYGKASAIQEVESCLIGDRMHL